MKEGLTSDQQKEWARLLYTRHDKNIQDIALTVGVEQAAVRKWIHDGGWDGMKRSLLISKGSQLTQLYNMLEKLTEKMQDQDEISTKDVDLMIKYTAAIKNLEKEISIPDMIQVVEDFTSWLLRKDVPLAKKVTVELDIYIKQIAASAA